jgi:hypothetical protein
LYSDSALQRAQRAGDQCDVRGAARNGARGAADVLETVIASDATQFGDHKQALIRRFAPRNDGEAR